MKVTIKKIEAPKYTQVEMREPTIGDCIKAQVLSEEKDGIKYTCALWSICATFDGKKLLMEDILEMPESFFLDVMAGVVGLSKAQMQKMLREEITKK